MTPQQIKDLFSKEYGRLLLLVIVGVLIVVGVIINNRLGQDHRTDQKVNAWHTKYGYMITNLTNAFIVAESDSKANDYPQLSADCVLIQKYAAEDQKQPKIPDPSVQQLWIGAMKDDETGAQLCQEGESKKSTALMSQASTYLNKGTANLELVAKDFQAAQQNK